MKLKRVDISNFRSIGEMKLSFKGHGHKVLVGKNESGKSNILRALNLLSGESFEKKHQKIVSPEPHVVIFVFDLERDEILECKSRCMKNFLPGDQAQLTRDYSVESFFEDCCKEILYIRESGADTTWQRWALNKNIKINDGWYQINESVVSHGLDEEDFPAGSYINEEFIQQYTNDDVIRDVLQKIDINDIRSSFHSTIIDTLELADQTFPVTYWKYNSQEHDLPISVNREEFSEDPDLCIPLKNMFLLSNIKEDEIHQKILDANDQGPNHLKSLLDQVNKKTKKYIRDGWKEYGREYKSVKIELRADGEDIVIGIKDTKNIFDFEQRSDGFRRFISFLLLTMKKKNSLILIDEPETGLHPSSAKDLRDKLINLAKENVVVYATHSISMIDTENIENNLIVSKTKENTSIKIAKEDGTSPAENVYQSIGYSIYEDLKKTNILLEGYIDKKILRLFMKDKKWDALGICYTSGVNNIRNVCPMLDLLNRQYFILSDADEIAKEKKKKFGDPKRWFNYKDLGCDAITIEDFYEPKFFFDIAQEVLKEHKIEISEERCYSIDRIQSLKDFLKEKNKIDNSTKEIIGKIKRQCADSAQEDDLDKDKIEMMLDVLLEKIASES